MRLIPPDAFLTDRREQLVALAAQYAVPTFYFEREFVVSGGLISYGVPLRELYRQAGIYAGQILKGAKAGELPIVQATKFELVINSTTAKALGITIPEKTYRPRRRGDRSRGVFAAPPLVSYWPGSTVRRDGRYV